MRGVAGSTPGCGTLARYRAGCKCDVCCRAKSRHEKVRVLRLLHDERAYTDRRGTIRRIQALRAIGWSLSALAARLGCTMEALCSLCKLPDSPIHVDTAAKVAVLFDELCMRPGRSTRARKYAERKGWLPPLAWDDIDHDPEPAKVERIDAMDEAAVLRKMRGEAVRVTHEERREVVRRLHRQGLSDGQIARLTGINGRQVLRDRQRLGLPANDEGRVAS